MKRPTRKQIQEEIEKIAAGKATKRQQWLFDQIMKSLFRTVNLAELKKGFKSLNDQEKRKYKAEAKALKSLEVYDWLEEQMSKQIQAKIYFESNTKEEIEKNQMGLWVLAKMREMIEELAREKKVYRPLQ